jgi:hypothetical protein
VLSLALAAVCASAAHAEFGPAPGTLAQTLSDAQAGSHPDLSFGFDLDRDSDGRIDGDLRGVDVELPPGMVGSALATPTCPVADVMAHFGPTCPTDTIVGFVSGTIQDPNNLTATSDVQSFVYNVDPYADEPAAFAMNPYFPVRLDVSVGPENGYRIRATAKDIIKAQGIGSLHLIMWGVPGDHNGYPANPSDPVYSDAFGLTLGGRGAGVRKPLLINPTACSGAPLVTDVRLGAWGSPGRTFAGQITNDPIFGCDRLRFEPTIRVRPVSHTAGVPTGYTVDLDVPQDLSPDSLSTPTLDDAKVVFPEGVVLSPGVAHGLGACSDAQIALHKDTREQCPASAKIGEVTVTSPLIRAPIDGDVFVGQPLPGNRYRVFFALDGIGVKIKLEGKVTLDPSTGQITATFLDNPQLPFSNMHIAFKGGANAPFANPASCGSKTVTSELTSHGGQSATPSSTFAITDGCEARGFAPRWTAGSSDPTAGASGQFELRVSRSDGDQEIDRIVADMPAGLLGYVAKVSRCPLDAAAAGGCGDDSQIGATTVAAGPGSDPFPVDGKVFLTDGYGGAPFGLAFTTRVIAGPYDLGIVNVRAKITVDPKTAALHVDSEPLPRILEGIPLQIKNIKIVLDRPGFMRNPTSCAPAAISGSIVSTGGTVTGVSSPFRVTDCDQLPLHPDLSLSLSGAKETTDGKHPAVKAVVTQGDGEAAMKKVQVTLPLSLALDPNNAEALCEFVDGQKDEPTCPKTSIVGTAVARTPVLNEPLTGPVYFVKNVRIDKKSGQPIRTLPTLAIPLQGQGVKLILRASSSVVHDKLVTTFDNIPDAPVSRFELNIDGGKHGILAVSNHDICAATQVAEQQIDGQNGKAADAEVFMATPSCPMKVLSKSVGKTSIKLKVAGLAPGRLKASGRGAKTTTKSIAKSTVVTLSVPLTRSGRRHRPTRIKVAFTPAGATKARTTVASLRPVRSSSKR